MSTGIVWVVVEDCCHDIVLAVCSTREKAQAWMDDYRAKRDSVKGHRKDALEVQEWLVDPDPTRRYDAAG